MELSQLLTPILTEKAAYAGSEGVYTFAVATTATKLVVAREIKARYGVTPLSVRMVRTQPRTKIRRGREVSVSGSKKAYITIPKGQTIDFTK